jgi:hypothetical protein
MANPTTDPAKAASDLLASLVALKSPLDMVSNLVALIGDPAGNAAKVTKTLKDAATDALKQIKQAAKDRLDADCDISAAWADHQGKIDAERDALDQRKACKSASSPNAIAIVRSVKTTRGPAGFLFISIQTGRSVIVRRLLFGVLHFSVGLVEVGFATSIVEATALGAISARFRRALKACGIETFIGFPTTHLSLSFQILKRRRRLLR